MDLNVRLDSMIMFLSNMDRPYRFEAEKNSILALKDLYLQKAVEPRDVDTILKVYSAYFADRGYPQ
jgi:hypothetical protein